MGCISYKTLFMNLLLRARQIEEELKHDREELKELKKQIKQLQKHEVSSHP